MNQNSYQAITAMLNAFPQSAADTRALLLTYEQALAGLDNGAIVDAAAKFIRGEVSGQNRTFAPSVAEFTHEVRRTPIPGRSALPPARATPYREPSRAERVRMGFKMSLLSVSLGRAGGPDALAEANGRGLEELVALAQMWEVPVPDELFNQLELARAA